MKKFVIALGALVMCSFVSTVMSTANAAGYNAISPDDRAVEVAVKSLAQEASENAKVQSEGEACGKKGILVSFTFGNSVKTYLVTSNYFLGDSSINVETCK